jgi:hypothetical protein
MKVSVLLKQKNKLAGEMSRLRELIDQENVVLNSNKRSFDISALYGELLEKARQLQSVKTTLAVANSAIYAKIFEIAELKGQVAFLNALSVREGTFITGHGEDRTETLYTPALNKVFVESEIKRLSERIEIVQEELDEFNHTAHV